MVRLSKANMKHLLNNQQVYSDSTMNKWTKAELIKYIRMCEKNINALSEQVENQYQLLLKYTDENNKNKSMVLRNNMNTYNTINICKAKTKAIHPHIIAKTIYKREIDKNVPYYEIEYYDIAGGTWYEGYGSTDLELVQKWLHEYFEVIEEDIVPVVHGSWKAISQSEYFGVDSWMNDSIVSYICTNCDEEAIYSISEGFVLSDYCSYCGAKMFKETY